jgi:hypothetical protein
MYHYSKIKDVITIYNQREIYHMNVINILQLFKIARSTLYEWLRNFSDISTDSEKYVLHRQLGSSIIKNTKVTSDIQNFIINYVLKNPTFNISKLSKKLTKMYNITISRGYIYWILNKNNMTHKKIQKDTYPYDKIKFKNALKDHKKHIDECDNDFTAVDETAVYLGTSNNYGWARRGKRCIVKSTFNRSNRHSLCMAISKSFVVGSKLIKGSYNMQKFDEFIINDDMPNMPNDTILMDGATIHKSKALAEILKNNNKKKIFNIPYSPQYNPIEFVFNTMKADIKKNNVTSLNQLKRILLKNFKKGNINGYENYYDHTYNNILRDLKK